jgi:hypothetical protein
MIQNLSKLLTIALASLFANAAMAQTPVEPANQDSLSTLKIVSEPRFKGFSRDAIAADGGLAGMHDACSATYGKGARMCLDIEVFKTPGLKKVSSVTKGWLQPTSQLSGDNPGSLSCNGWSVDTGAAATWLTGEMQIIYASKHHQAKRYDSRGSLNSHCENHLPVACCQ